MGEKSQFYIEITKTNEILKNCRKSGTSACLYIVAMPSCQIILVINIHDSLAQT